MGNWVALVKSKFLMVFTGYATNSSKALEVNELFYDPLVFSEEKKLFISELGDFLQE